jgi:FkbM family methyltransferase
MNFKTKFLNIFRRISQLSSVEKILAENIRNGSKISKKLIAGNGMYPKGTIRTCNRDGIHFKLDISDYMEHAIYFGINDTVDFDRRMLYSLIKENYTCFDIGANIGETTLNFAKLAVNGKIYSFEPVPFLFQRLKTNVELNNFQNISLNNLAISDKQEELFFENPNNNNSSGISLNKEKSASSSIVHSTTIDSFVSENNIEKIDFMKIDVEGFENFVINGGTETLKKMKPVLFIEIDNKNLYKNNSSEKILLTQLQNEFGYTLYRIDGIEKTKLTVLENTNEHYDVLCIAE